MLAITRIVVWLAILVAGAVTERMLGHRASRADSATARLTDQALQVVIVVALAGGPVSAAALPRAGLPLAGAWLAAGALVACAGVALRVVAMRALGQHFTLTPTLLHGHDLITSGPYAFVRHPGYTAFVLQFAGLEMVTGSGAALALVLPVAAFALWRIRVEERMLVRHFGGTYRRYQASTRYRLLPGIL